MSPLFDALVENAIRSTVLLVFVAVGTLALLRRSSAARKHLVWTIAFISLLLMPVFPAIFPTITVVPQQLVPAPEPDTVVALPIQDVAPADSVAATPVQRPSTAALPWRTIMVVAWAVGAVLCLVPLLLARLRLGRMLRAGQETRLFGTEVTLCPDCQMPMAAGLWHRRILLPADASCWDAPKLRAVLAHESAHVRRRDCLWRLIGQLACALHWYNPLAWYALRRLQIEGEHACDDAVLLAGQESEGYAQQLLSIATAGRSDAILAAAAIAMARPSTLEGRLMSILDSARSRKRVTGGIVAVTGMLIVALGVIVAAAGAADREPAAVAAGTTSPAAELHRVAPAGPVTEIIPADIRGQGVFYVTGAVDRIGTYAINEEPQITVKQALISAGLNSNELMGLGVRITRRMPDGKEKVIDMDLESLFANKVADRYVQPNDTLQVRRTSTESTGRNAFRMPIVHDATPDNRQTGVDPATKELRITFDQPMNTKGFSWTGGGKAFPKTTGPAKWIDDRTCVLPVELEPGHDYWFSVNNASFQGFKNIHGQPAQSYPVWFQTAGGDPANPPSGQPKVSSTEPANNTQVDASVTEIRATFDQPMIQDGLAWVQIDTNFPKTTGKAHWVDERTCVLPVKLEPDKQYRLSLNAPGYPGFTGMNGVSAEPKVLSFMTK